VQRLFAGREIGFFGDSFILQGGPMLHWDQPAERIMTKGNKMTFFRLGGDGAVKIPTVIPFDAWTGFPVWDADLFLTRSTAGRDAVVTCSSLKGMQKALVEIHSAQEEKFAKRKSHESAILGLTGRTATKKYGDLISKLAAPAWSINFGRGKDELFAMTLAKNTVMIIRGNTREKKWSVAAYDRKEGKEIWTCPLPSEPLYNGVSVTRTGRIVVSLINGDIVAIGE